MGTDNYFFSFTSYSRYEVPLTCKGGDGAFIWSSGNTSVATVSGAGLVRTLTLGQSTITAVMLNNPHNQATASVTVLPPSKLTILGKFEV